MLRRIIHRGFVQTPPRANASGGLHEEWSTEFSTHHQAGPKNVMSSVRSLRLLLRRCMLV
jgi:hypothetical protein